MEQNTPSRFRALTATGLLLGLGLLTRLPFITVDFWPRGDIKIFRFWGERVYQLGIAEIYSEPGVDYPPLLLYLLGGAYAAAQDLDKRFDNGEQVSTALIKLPSAVADVATAGLLAWAVRRRGGLASVMVGALYLLTPAVWYVSVYWGQTDSVYTLFLVAAVVALEENAARVAWTSYALAMATKLQSVALAPLIILVTWARHGIRGLVGGLAVATIVGGVLTAPWILTGHIGDLLHSVTALPGRADVSGYNLWYLLLGGQVHNVPSTIQPIFIPLSYQQLGLTLFGSFALLVLILVRRNHADSLALPAALLSLGFFMLLTEIHERYLFPTLAFLLLAAFSQREDPQIPMAGKTHKWHSPLMVAFIIVSLTFLYNLVTIAPFTPVLGSNLVYEVANFDSLRVQAMNVLALSTAAINLVVMAWLTKTLAHKAHRREHRAIPKTENQN